jgi:hypothetical protein
VKIARYLANEASLASRFFSSFILHFFVPLGLDSILMSNEETFCACASALPLLRFFTSPARLFMLSFCLVRRTEAPRVHSSLSRNRLRLSHPRALFRFETTISRGQARNESEKCSARPSSYSHLGEANVIYGVLLLCKFKTNMTRRAAAHNKISS